MAEGKWITGLTSEMPIASAARLVLRPRLDAVTQHLPLAILSAARDPEHVHQLRVATRRATAALRLFAESLPTKNRRSLRRSLQSIRRAAGAARDWDVFSEMLRTAPALQQASSQVTRDFLIGLQTAYRCEAQRQLLALNDGPADQFNRQARKLGEKTFAWRADTHRTTGQLARDQISALLDEFTQATSSTPAEYESLHRIRILGKRLRYSMEVFIDCFEPALGERLYPAIVEMQEILGAVTDAHVAAERFIELREHLRAFHRQDWTRYRNTMNQLLQAQRRIFPRERKRFISWLVKWRELTDAASLRDLLK